MDTIKKLSDYAIVTGQPTRFVGCPKTIDNDLALHLDMGVRQNILELQ